MKTRLRKFDPIEVLRSEQDIADYVNLAFKEGGSELMMSALDDVARALGLGAIAERSGLGRESLYKTLRPGRKPQFETMVRILESIGLTFVVVRNE